MNKTELVFILDMSGSMANLTDDTIGGFNSILNEQTKTDGEVLVTTYLFNNRSVMLHDRVPIREVKPMTADDYRAGGCTALVDAIGEAIQHIVGIYRYARKEDIPAKTIFAITTDGMENASHRFTAERVREMIRHEQEKYNWEFLFLAANIDAVETARHFGIRTDQAIDYVPDSCGTGVVYETINHAIGNVRKGATLSADLSWRKKADRDYKKRGK